MLGVNFEKEITLEEMFDWMGKCKGYKATKQEFKSTIL